MIAIPKKIHYCWFGNNPKPPLVKYCIESWKKYCSDYEIIEWNENNYDVQKNEYMKQAYIAQKWGFVPDYARLDIIYQYGGIYFDTDVELLKSPDSLRSQNAFFGFEDTGDGEYFVSCGLGFGSIPNNHVIGKLRDIYERICFVDENGELNLTPSPYYTTRVLQSMGLKRNNKDQLLSDTMIYASDALCPKNYRTGKITISSRTISTHHFEASWVDEEIKSNEHMLRDITNKYGNNIGRKILYIKSVLKKNGLLGTVKKIPPRGITALKRKLIEIDEAAPYYAGLYEARQAKRGYEAPIILDTYMNSKNQGDAIIMEACIRELSSCLNVSECEHIPTHIVPSEGEIIKLANSKFKILCGTNILSGDMRHYGLWKLTPDVSPYNNTILMGVGFDSKNRTYTEYTKELFKIILSKEWHHAVRDSFSMQMLASMGITNVLNTSCPTVWDITPELCSNIPRKKGKSVICTLTDYNQDEKNDRFIINTLIDLYDKVYIWIQGGNDRQYVEKLGYDDKLLCIIPSDLSELDKVLSLDDLDYVGTRLHAGIRAIKKGHRSIVISIDNRAECISEDIGLPIVSRNDVSFMLHNYILNDFETILDIPYDNINKFKEQFVRP